VGVRFVVSDGCGVAVELASKDVQRELDKIQQQLAEFLTAEENAMKERIRYDIDTLVFIHCVPEKSTSFTIVDRNAESQCIVTKLRALDSECISERTTKFC